MNTEEVMNICRFSKKQEFITFANKRLSKVDEEILNDEMEKYRKQFGFTKEDFWLWLAGCNDRDLEVSFAAVNMEHRELKNSKRNKQNDNYYQR